MICLRTVKDFCKDFTKIENYDKAIADKTQTWECHHRIETHNSDGEKRLVHLTREELKMMDMYYNRPSDELIFLTKVEHRNLHHKGRESVLKGKKCSEETRQKNVRIKKRQTSF